MDVSTIIAIFGGVALLVAISGGGIEAERIKIPTVSKLSRFIAGFTGVILIVASVWLSQTPPIQPDINPQLLSTSTPPIPVSTINTQPIASPLLTTPIVNQDKIVFSLKDATEKSLYSLGEANVLLGNDKSLKIYGNFYDGVYLREKMPENFRAIVHFTTGEFDEQFIMGLSDGVNWIPNFHFVMLPGWATFKQQIQTDDDWDFYLQTVNKGGTRPNSSFVVEFERIDGNIRIFVNNETIILYGEKPEEINNYNYLYFTGDQHQPYTIYDLTIEDLNR